MYARSTIASLSFAFGKEGQKPDFDINVQATTTIGLAGKEITRWENPTLRLTYGKDDILRRFDIYGPPRRTNPNIAAVVGSACRDHFQES